MSKQRGYTFLVILIAMLIIGFVAGKYFMDVFREKEESPSSREVIPLARVSRIVSDLNALKTASLSCYAENSSWPADLDQIQHIIGHPGLEEQGYFLHGGSFPYPGKDLHILKDMTEEPIQVRMGLADKAANLSLFGTDDPEQLDEHKPYSQSDQFVYMVLHSSK